MWGKTPLESGVSLVESPNISTAGRAGPLQFGHAGNLARRPATAQSCSRSLPWLNGEGHTFHLSDLYMYMSHIP